MPFVQFIPREKHKKIEATLTPKGALAFPVETAREFGLGGVTHVLLFVDPDRRAVGLRPATPDAAGALKLNSRKRVVSLSVRSLLEEYRLVVPGKLLLEPYFDERENLLVIPLVGVHKRAGRRPSGGRTGAIRRPRQKQAAATASVRKRGRPPKKGKKSQEERVSGHS